MGVLIRSFLSPHGSRGGMSPAHTAHDTQIHWLGAGRAAPEVIAGVPSIHMAWNGNYPLCVDGRQLRLDDDVFLVLNASHMLSTRGWRDATACLLSVYFAPQLLTRALDVLSASQREMLEARTPNGSFCLFEHLRERDKSIASVMRYIAHHFCEGVEDPDWYEEQVTFLLRRLLASELGIAQTISRMAHTKAWKRREIYVRLARVTDLIHTAYERPLAMTDLAEAAHWSAFHMMREFKAVRGVSPYEFLQRRRTQAAARLLCSTGLSVAQITERVGFRERSTLMRRLRRSRGLGPRALRVSPPLRPSQEEQSHA